MLRAEKNAPLSAQKYRYNDRFRPSCLDHKLVDSWNYLLKPVLTVYKTLFRFIGELLKLSVCPNEHVGPKVC